MAPRNFARLSRVLQLAPLLASALAIAPARATEAAAPVIVTYGVSIAHVPIGTAKFSETLKDQTFHLHLAAEFSGLVRMFFAPDLSADSEGSVVNDRIVPKHYQMIVNHPDDPQKVSMSLVGGTVVSAELHPPLTVRADRVPVLPEHKHGVVDPLSGFLIPMKMGADVTPELCTRVIPVFDGGGRFDITLSPGSAGTLDIPGYKGPVVTCPVRYTPISGHREKKNNVTYMENNRDISVTLAPMAGKPYLVPVKISIATLIGDIRLEAEKVDGLDLKPDTKPSSTSASSTSTSSTSTSSN